MYSNDPVRFTYRRNYKVTLGNDSGRREAMTFDEASAIQTVNYDAPHPQITCSLQVYLNANKVKIV